MAALAISKTSSLPALPWLRRYVPMELCGLLAALVCGSLAETLTHNPALIAITSAWCANAAYYGWAFATDLRKCGRPGETRRTTSARTVWATAWALVLEFGLAELLDAVLIRPALVLASLRIIGNTQIGIVFGGLVADAAFYALVIASRRMVLCIRPG